MLEIDKIYNADCLELMKEIPDKSIDMICADNPYSVLSRSNPKAQWDTLIPLEPLWDQYERVIKDNGAIILFGQGMFTAQLMMSNPKLWRYNLIWDKHRVTGFLNANKMPLRCHEDICVFYKQLPTYNPQMEELNGRERNHPQGYGEHREYNQCYGKIKRITPQIYDKKHPRSIIKIPREHDGKQIHATQKPVELIRWLIRSYSNEGDIVLDNCSGSGTTAVAAFREKRHFICIEKDPRYWELSVERINKVMNEPTIF